MASREQGKFTSEEQYKQLSEQLQAAQAELEKQKDIVRVLKGNKETPKDEIQAAVAILKQHQAEVERLTSLWRDADPSKLHISRSDFDELMARRFFITPSFEIYGGVAGLYDYGPPACAIKANFLNLWRQHYVLEENMLELDCTCLTPEPVFITSGHVARFNDLMVKDVKTGGCYRADKLLLEFIERELANPATNAQRAQELEQIKNQVDSLSAEELGETFRKYGIKSPETNNELSDPFPFNLMFNTQIGPSGKLQGYLRPETAQGIFVNFKRLLDYNGGNMPFAGATVGQAFRNEIAPRSGLLRVREFTLAEIEHFCNPNDKSHSKFDNVRNITVSLYSRECQAQNSGPISMTIGDAVQQGVINNETLGYFVGRTYLFLTECGIIPSGLRFRQHLANEMAHYATDCWDAEILTSYGWVETVGIADRACYDLQVHAQKCNVELAAFEPFAEPKVFEVVEVTQNKGAIGRAFLKKSSIVLKYIKDISTEDAVALEAKLNADGSAVVELEGESFELKRDMLVFTKKTKKVAGRNYTPSVIEPSFGVGRIIYGILEHSYWVRPTVVKSDASTSADADKDDDKLDRAVLSLPASIAPYKCAVIPLSKNATFTPTIRSLSAALAHQNISYKVDEGVQSVGRKYARTDELGVPFIITIDFKTVEDNTVTLRERDSCTQIRASADEIVSIVKNLIEKKLTWADVRANYQEQKQSVSELIGAAN